MPFTLAHAAAALPLRRTRLITSALVIGTFAPDLEYFIRLRAGGGFGHTLQGAFEMSLPIGLAVLWLFHRVVKRPFTWLLPLPVQRRLSGYIGQFPFSGFRRIALIVVSILIGIATHIIWDSFTHANTWTYRHIPLLSHKVHVPFFGRVIGYDQVCQHLSSVLGCVVLLLWILHWYRTTQPGNQPERLKIPTSQQVAILTTIATLSLVGGIIRASIRFGVFPHPFPFNNFLGDTVCTFVALAWWQFVLFGIVSSRRGALVSVNS